MINQYNYIQKTTINYSFDLQENHLFDSNISCHSLFVFPINKQSFYKLINISLQILFYEYDSIPKDIYFLAKFCKYSRIIPSFPWDFHLLFFR